MLFGKNADSVKALGKLTLTSMFWKYLMCRGYSEPCQTSKAERFAKIGTGF